MDTSNNQFSSEQPAQTPVNVPIPTPTTPVIESVPKVVSTNQITPQVVPTPTPPPTQSTIKKNILLVEDDPVIIRMYSTKLTNSGYEVREAVNGQEALELLSTFHPNIILLDLMLPQLDGFGFLQKAKELIVNIPVIILSNLSQDTDKSKAREYGVVDFLVKADITPQDVVNTIQKHI